MCRLPAIIDPAPFRYIDGGAERCLTAVLAWTVRKGGTNVIQHSRAHHCTIRVMCAGESVGAEMVDDGARRTICNAFLDHLCASRHLVLVQAWYIENDLGAIECYGIDMEHRKVDIMGS